MKEIIVGPPFIGKSTLVRHLRQAYPDLRVMELDEMILEANNQIWPDDRNIIAHLIPLLTENVLALDHVLFFTGYIDPSFISLARQKGFTIIQLTLNPGELKKRNIHHDREREAEMLRNLKYQHEIRELVNIQIRADKPVAQLAQEILDKSSNL